MIIFALGIIAWFAWQLYRAKQFTRFRKYLVDNVQPQVLEHIEQHLIESRDNCFPNNDCHISASKIYWTACHARILQYALIHEILSENSIKMLKNCAVTNP
mgnify:CR=1 FL=1